LAQVTGHERLMRVPTPVGTDHQSQVTTHAAARCGFRSCRRVSLSDVQRLTSNLQGVTDHESQVTTHAPARCGFRSCRWVSPSDFQPPASNLQGATDHGPWATSALCESRLPSGRTTGHNSLITSRIYFSLALRILRIVDLAHC